MWRLLCNRVEVIKRRRKKLQKGRLEKPIAEEDFLIEAFLGVCAFPFGETTPNILLQRCLSRYQGKFV